MAHGSKGRPIFFGVPDGETPDVPKCEECGDLIYCTNRGCKTCRPCDDSGCKTCHPPINDEDPTTDFGYLVGQGPKAFMANPPLEFRVGEPWFLYPMTFSRIDNTDNYFCYQISREVGEDMKEHGYLYHWKTQQTLTHIINERNGSDENARWTWTKDMRSIREALMELRIQYRATFE